MSEYMDTAGTPARMFEMLLGRAQNSEVWPFAAVLATSNANGEPSARQVLTKPTPDGIVFGANATSPKMQDLSIHAAAELCYIWPSIATQVRIRGVARILPESDADGLFQELPAAIKDVEHLNAEGATILDENYGESLRDAQLKRNERPRTWRAVMIMPDEYRFWLSFDETDRLSIIVKRGLVGWEPTAVPA